MKRNIKGIIAMILLSIVFLGTSVYLTYPILLGNVYKCTIEKNQTESKAIILTDNGIQEYEFKDSHKSGKNSVRDGETLICVKRGDVMTESTIVQNGVLPIIMIVLSVIMLRRTKIEIWPPIDHNKELIESGKEKI